MKTLVFSFFFIFGLLDVSIAQQKMGAPLSKAASENCIGSSQNPLPYSPRFGSSHDTATEVKKWGFGFYNEAYSSWSFQTISASDTALAPFFQGSSSAIPIPIPIFFPCFQMESEKTYRLDFTYVGLTAGKNNTLRLVATQIVNGHYDEQNLIPLGTLTGLNSGSSQQNIVLDKHNLSGNYHLGLICDNFGTTNIFYLKNFRLSELSAYDLSLLGFEAPLSQCEINNQKVSLSLQNLGSSTPSSYRICYTISDGQNTSSSPHCETFTTAIPMNAKASLTFQTPVNVGNAEQVSFQAWIENTYSDGNTANDSLSAHIVRRYDQITPPYRCDFSSAENQRQWTSISPHKPSAKGWEMNILNAEGAAVLRTDLEAADDWLISTCVQLKKDSLYRFRVNYQSLGSLPENLKLKVGQNSSPSGLSVLLQEVKGFSNTQKQVLDAYYKAPADGNYFFGLHAENELPGTGIRIQQIEISSTTPQKLPLYRSFESFEEASAWMSISRNNNVWSDTSDSWQGKAALKSSVLASDSNFLCSPPLYLESGKTYEIVYSRKAFSSSREYLHLLLGQSNLLSDLKTHSVLLRDSLPQQSMWNLKTHYFQVKQNGVYFLAFQYAKGTKGIALDEIELRDSLTGSKNNISILNLEIPKPSCRLSTNERVFLTLKNHSAATLIGSSISAAVEVNGTKLSPSATGLLKPYEIITKEFSGIDLHKDTLYNIRAWINHASDINRSDDTSATLQTERIKPFTGLLQSSFENDADNRRWTISSEGSGTYTSWTFPSMPNSAYSGTKVAYLANPQVVNSTKDYLISPCINLSADTTYLVAFYYKVVDPLKSDSLSLVWGSNPASLLPVNPTIRVENNEYKRMVRYIRPTYSETLYVGIRAESQKLKGGMIIDDFVMVDSLTATIPQLALKGVSLASSRSCDLSADTLKVTLKNKGFFDYSQAKVTILFSDGRLKTESLAGTIAQGKEKSFVLQTLWEHRQWGKDSIRILLDIAQDTSAFFYVEKHAAATVPYTVNFQTPETYQAWNLASHSEKASFGGDSCRYFTLANGKASFANGTAEGKSGLLLSHCFLLNASDGPFRISFSYRAINAVQKEKMEVYLLHPQGKKVLLGTLNDFAHTNYLQHRIALDSLPSGAYKIAFYSPFHSLAKGIDIGEFVACPDTSRWPADLRVKRIILPSSNLNPSTSESIGVVLENVNKRPLKDITVTLAHQAHLYTETIASLRPGDSIRYTFSHTLDLSAEGEHTLYVFTGLAGDINRLNDTIKGVFTSQLSSDLSVEEIILPTTALDELTASENITIVVKNKNRKTLENAKVFLRIDQAHPLQSPIRSLSSNDTAHCLFTALDFSAEKTYAILAYVALSEDIDRANDSARTVLTHAPTALQQQQEEAIIKIYPNPARQRLFVESSENLKNIELFNVAGQSLERLSTHEKSASLDVSRHKAGVYFLRITTTAGGSFTKSLIITRE